MDKIFKKTVSIIQKFEPRYDHGDLIWEFYYSHSSKWHYLRVQKYQNTYYFFGSNFEPFSTEKERELEPKVQALLAVLPSILEKIYSEVKKDSIAYNLKLNRSVSPHLRKGIIPRYFVHKLIPEYMRFDQELKRSEIKKMTMLSARHMDSEIDEMTAQKFFNYCKVAYLANGRKSHSDMNLKSSGFDLYDRFADGRDGGLKTIDRNSPKAFETWYHGDKWSGCHPWEIYRGGNSTHIDLAVVHDKFRKKWKIVLSAFSSTRLVETCRIALALQKANLPFELSDFESYFLRLTGNDWVGILPGDSGLKYGWHYFPKDWHVADCIYFSFFKDDFGKTVRPLKNIKGLITWFPLPTQKIK